MAVALVFPLACAATGLVALFIALICSTLEAHLHIGTTAHFAAEQQQSTNAQAQRLMPWIYTRHRLTSPPAPWPSSFFPVPALASETARYGPVLPRQLPLSEPLPPCLWDRMREYCRQKLGLSASPGEPVNATWSMQLHCSAWRPSPQRPATAHIKLDSLEFENLVLRGCVNDTLGIAAPQPGLASLPLSAFHRGSARGASISRVTHKLARGDDLRIVAVGASVTNLAAGLCAEKYGGCEIGPRVPLADFDARMSERAALLHRQPEADYLVRLLRTLHRRYPMSAIHASTVAYGGMSVRSVSSCPADFFGVAAQGHHGTSSWPDMVCSWPDSSYQGPPSLTPGHL